MEPPNMDVDVGKAKRLLTLWMLRAHRAASAHYLQSVTYRRANTVMTIVNTTLSITILFLANQLSLNAGDSESMFARMIVFDDAVEWVPWMVAIATTALAIMGITQFILRYSERNGEHREAGQEFSNLQRKIERYCLYQTHTMAQIHNISREYNHITRSYPLVSRKIWNQEPCKLKWWSKKNHKLVGQIEKIEDELRGVNLVNGTVSEQMT